MPDYRAATLFRLGWQVYKFLMSNFLGILYTDNCYNRLIFRQVIQNTKGKGVFETRCMSIPYGK